MLLSDVCLSVAYIGRNSRTEMPRKTKNGRGSTRHTTFQVKRSKVNLLLMSLNSRHAGTGATWRINTKILSTCRGAEAYRGGRPPTACFLNNCIKRRLRNYDHSIRQAESKP